ncbi:MAG: sugar phosphate isomerase/epimerase family protein [Verrucomicrobium sp.]
MQRRAFLSSTLAAIGAGSLPAFAAGPINRAGKSRMMLGLAAYSFREYFKWMRGKEQKPKDGKPQWEINDFIDYCAEQNCPGAELTSYFFPPTVDAAYLLEVKRHAYLRGVNITGSAVGNNFALAKGKELDDQIADVKKWIDYSAIMGAPHIRVFAGSPKKDLNFEEATANCIGAYQECLDYAGQKGVFLGIENHHGLVAEPANLIKIIEGVRSAWAGINFDSGNFITADPYGDLEKIAPYAINVQLKMRVKPTGGPKEGEASDVPRVIKMLRNANYQGWFTLEFEDKEDPFVAVPRILNELRPLLG